MASARIPRGIDEFNTYIGNTNSYLLAGTPTNANRLGVTPEELTQWTGFATDWAPLYLKYSDKKNSRTTAIKDQLLEIIGNTTDFDQRNHVLDRIAASPNVTIVDMETFNIKKGVLQKTSRLSSNTPIAEAVTVTIQLLGGGMVTIKCYSTTGQRASIYNNADSVEYLYQVGTTPPVAADENVLKKGISTKGSFTVALNPDTPGKFLYIYFRWYNTKHPELAGPWSSLQTTMIM